MEKREEADKIKWHPGFCGGIELELRDYRDILDFEPEHYLSKEPLRIDMLVFKKKSNAKIDNPIAEMFRKHNVVEYKSPKDSLSIDSFYKTIGYACLYKGMGNRVGEISEKELEKGEHSVLKVLTGNADENEVRRFIREAKKYITPEDKQNVDAVLQVSVSSNTELFQKLRKEKAMCVALNNLMKDELDAREARGEARGEAQGVNKLKEAIIAIKNGIKPSEIKKKYGKEIFDAADSVIKSLA